MHTHTHGKHPLAASVGFHFHAISSYDVFFCLPVLPLPLFLFLYFLPICVLSPWPAIFSEWLLHKRRLCVVLVVLAAPPCAAAVQLVQPSHRLPLAYDVHMWHEQWCPLKSFRMRPAKEIIMELIAYRRVEERGSVYILCWYFNSNWNSWILDIKFVEDIEQFLYHFLLARKEEKIW